MSGVISCDNCGKQQKFVKGSYIPKRLNLRREWFDLCNSCEERLVGLIQREEL